MHVQIQFARSGLDGEKRVGGHDGVGVRNGNGDNGNAAFEGHGKETRFEVHEPTVGGPHAFGKGHDRDALS